MTSFEFTYSKTSVLFAQTEIVYRFLSWIRKNVIKGMYMKYEDNSNIKYIIEVYLDYYEFKISTDKKIISSISDTILHETLHSILDQEINIPIAGKAHHKIIKLLS